jgi:hypothetical protein
VENQVSKARERIKVEGNKVQLFINPKFYNFEAVKKVKEEFEQVCDVVAADEKSTIFVEMQPKEKVKFEELEILGYEFYNHLLSEVKEMGGE